MFIHLLEIYIIHESLKIHLTIREKLTDDFGNQSRNESLAVADAHLSRTKCYGKVHIQSQWDVSHPEITVGFTKGKCWDIYLLLISVRVSLFITPILKSLDGPCYLIGSNFHELHQFFASNRIFFPANEEATLKAKQPIGFQGMFKVTNQIAGKLKTKSIMWQILQLLFPKLLFPPLKMDEFNFKPAVLHQ